MADRALKFVLTGEDKTASRAFDKVGGSADKTHGRIKGMAVGIGGALAGVGLAKFAKSSVEAFKESEDSAARLQAAFDKFPALADSNIGAFQKLNTQLAAKTKYDDDATASGQAVLAQFKLTGSQILQLTPLLQDYASKTGKDLPTAAQDLGKAMNGQGRALKAIGLNFKDTGDKTKNLAQLQAGLRQQVGGFAEREGKTGAGQAAILANRFGEVQEEIGGKLVPALNVLAGWLVRTIDFIDRNQRVIVPLVAVLGGFAVTVWAVNTAARAYTATQAALNFVLSANPIGIVIVAVAALAVGLVMLWKHSETFRAVITGVFQAVGSVILHEIDLMLWAFDKLLAPLSHLPGKFGAPFRAARDAIGGARDKVHELEDGLNRLDGKRVHISVVTDYSSYGSNAGAVQANAAAHGRASGGSVFAGMPYLVGERGPELVVPAQSARVIPAGQTGSMLAGGGGGNITVNLTINSTVTDKAALDRFVAHDLAPAISRARRSGVTLGLA